MHELYTFIGGMAFFVNLFNIFLLRFKQKAVLVLLVFFM